MHDNSVLTLDNVHKTFLIESQKVHALRGVSFSLKKGDLIAITGKSGAGKSTLLHIMGTLDTPSSGRILIDGNDVSRLDDKQRSVFRNKTLGFVFQMNNLLREFSALENVMLPGLIAGLPRAEMQERAFHVLQAVQMERRARHRPGELSGGEQQRVAIARALFMSPPVLLADEPTGNLDQNTSRSIQDLLLQLCADLDTTMVLVTHDLDLAKRLPQQIHMEDGVIV